MDFKRLAEQYKTELLDGVLPFWLEKSQDREFGGYFTCLDRDGSVYDTDKFIWLQGREVWMFAMLYNKVERRPEWLECAVQGAEFLRKYGHDGNYNWYFCADARRPPAGAALQHLLLHVRGDGLCAGRRCDGQRRIRPDRQADFRPDSGETRQSQRTSGARLIPERVRSRSFALPMILCNMALEIEPMHRPAAARPTRSGSACTK